MAFAERSGTAGRLVLAVFLATGLLVACGEPLVRICLPLLREAIALFAPDFVVENLSIAQLNADRVLRLDIANRYHLYLGGRLMPPGRSINATVNVLAPLVPVAAGLVTVVAWPGSWRALPWRLACLVPALVPVLAVDAPLVLVALTWDFWHYAMSPDEVSPWSLWMQFLTRGGRPALGIAAGLAALALAGALRSGRGMSRSAHVLPGRHHESCNTNP